MNYEKYLRWKGVLDVEPPRRPKVMRTSLPEYYRIPEKNLGTAYSLIYWVQNLGMWAVPIYVGRIFTKEITEAGNITQEISAAIHAEYVFIFLGVVAIGTALMLFFSSKNHPELHLDQPAQ